MEGSNMAYHWFMLTIFILIHCSLAIACQPGVQPRYEYCARITLANYTYFPIYHGDNVTYSTTPSFEKDVNVGFAKALQYDILRFLDAKGHCNKVKTGSVECFRPSKVISTQFGIPLLKINLKLSSSLNHSDLNKIISEIYSSPLSDPSFYRFNEPPELLDVNQIGAKCGCF